MAKFFFSALAIALSWPAIGYAQPHIQEIFVSSSWSDSNPGTQNAPFKSILKASQEAKPGTLIHVAPGTYEWGFVTQANGTADNPIVYVSDREWWAKIVPPKTSESRIAWTNSGAYVRIDGFEVDGTKDPDSWQKWSVGIDVNWTGDAVENCYIHNVYNSGKWDNNGGAWILLDSYYGNNDMHARRNFVHDIWPRSGGGEKFYHGIYQTATGSIEWNVSYGNTGWGIHLWHDAHDISVVGNAVFDNGSGIIVGWGDFVNTKGPCDKINVYDNLVISNFGAWVLETGYCGANNTFKGNAAYANHPDWDLKYSTWE